MCLPPDRERKSNSRLNVFGLGLVLLALIIYAMVSRLVH